MHPEAMFISTHIYNILLTSSWKCDSTILKKKVPWFIFPLVFSAYMEAIPNKNVRRFRLHFASSEGTRNVYPRKKHLNYTSSILFIANSGCQKNATPQPQTTIWRDTYWQKVVYQTISNSSQNILYYTIKVQTKLEWRLRTFLSDVNIWRSFGRHVPFYHHLHCTSWAVAPGWLLISCILVRPFWALTSQLFFTYDVPFNLNE